MQINMMLSCGVVDFVDVVIAVGPRRKSNGTWFFFLEIRNENFVLLII